MIDSCDLLKKKYNQISSNISHTPIKTIENETTFINKIK